MIKKKDTFIIKKKKKHLSFFFFLCCHLGPRTKYNLLSNKNLIIHNITKSDDNRKYACIVKNQIDNDTKQSRFKSLRVRGRIYLKREIFFFTMVNDLDRSPFGPELSISNNTEYRAQAGDLIELPCGISSISTHARISWWKNGIEISNLLEKIYNNSLILQLSKISTNDSGNYACRIDDESGGHMISVMYLKVDRKCKLILSIKHLIGFISVSIQCEMSNQQINYNAGSNIELICTNNLMKTFPIQWQWYYNSKLISINTERYLITNLTRKHMGMYQCCSITSSSDFNTCCAQTQIRVISKLK